MSKDKKQRVKDVITRDPETGELFIHIHLGGDVVMDFPAESTFASNAQIGIVYRRRGARAQILVNPARLQSYLQTQLAKRDPKRDPMEVGRWVDGWAEDHGGERGRFTAAAVHFGISPTTASGYYAKYKKTSKSG